MAEGTTSTQLGLWRLASPTLVDMPGVAHLSLPYSPDRIESLQPLSVAAAPPRLWPEDDVPADALEIEQGVSPPASPPGPPPPVPNALPETIPMTGPPAPLPLTARPPVPTALTEQHPTMPPPPPEARLDHGESWQSPAVPIPAPTPRAADLGAPAALAHTPAPFAREQSVRRPPRRESAPDPVGADAAEVRREVSEPTAVPRTTTPQPVSMSEHAAAPHAKPAALGPRPEHPLGSPQVPSGEPPLAQPTQAPGESGPKSGPLRLLVTSTPATSPVVGPLPAPFAPNASGLASVLAQSPSAVDPAGRVRAIVPGLAAAPPSAPVKPLSTLRVVIGRLVLDIIEEEPAHAELALARPGRVAPAPLGGLGRRR